MMARSRSSTAHPGARRKGRKYRRQHKAWKRALTRATGMHKRGPGF